MLFICLNQGRLVTNTGKFIHILPFSCQSCGETEKMLNIDILKYDLTFAILQFQITLSLWNGSWWEGLVFKIIILPFSTVLVDFKFITWDIFFNTSCSLLVFSAILRVWKICISSVALLYYSYSLVKTTQIFKFKPGDICFTLWPLIYYNQTFLENARLLMNANFYLISKANLLV